MKKHKKTTLKINNLIRIDLNIYPLSYILPNNNIYKPNNY
jgi:hypothetical protein